MAGVLDLTQKMEQEVPVWVRNTSCPTPGRATLETMYRAGWPAGHGRDLCGSLALH